MELLQKKYNFDLNSNCIIVKNFYDKTHKIKTF